MPRNFALALLLLALFCALTAPAQPINWDSVRADYITKYQPQQLPAWLFPIIFEEGGGQRDTIYLGYDEDASWRIDSLMGEKLELLDTTRFNSCWGGWCLNFDSVLFKVQIDNYISSGFSISFYKGLLPLKMYWDREAFYSDSLPFPDISPAPRAQGEFWYDLPMEPDGGNFMCNISVPVLLTDTVLYPWLCAFSDTVRFIHHLGQPNGLPSMTQLVVRPWTGNWVGIAERNNLGVEVYPNPATGHMYIHNRSPLPVTVALLSLNGSILYKGTTEGNTVLSVAVAHLPSGLYLLRAVAQSGGVFHTKIIVTN